MSMVRQLCMFGVFPVLVVSACRTPESGLPIAPCGVSDASTARDLAVSGDQPPLSSPVDLSAFPPAPDLAVPDLATPTPGLRVNHYTPLSNKTWTTQIPIDEAHFTAEAPYDCFGGYVRLAWDGLDVAGTMPHTGPLEGAFHDCDGSDVAIIRAAAAQNGGRLAATVRVEVALSLMYGEGDECFRGLLENVVVTLAGSTRLFQNVSWADKQQALPAALCDQLIATIRP